MYTETEIYEQAKRDISRKYKARYDAALNRVKVIAGVIIAIVLIFAAVISNSNKTYVEIDTVSVKVEAYDSVWGLSSQYCPDDMDMRDFVNIVMNKNNITGTIYEGQYIEIPVFVEVK